MPDLLSRASVSNLILKDLSGGDFALLAPDLQPITLPVRKVLEPRNRKVANVFFMESGFASIVANGASGPAIEVGIVGREGMTGLAVVMGDERPVHETNRFPVC